MRSGGGNGLKHVIPKRTCEGGGYEQIDEQEIDSANGEAYGKGRPHTFFTFGLNGAVVSLYDAFYNRKTKACSHDAPGFIVFYPVKSLKDPG